MPLSSDTEGKMVPWQGVLLAADWIGEEVLTPKKNRMVQA